MDQWRHFVRAADPLSRAQEITGELQTRRREFIAALGGAAASPLAVLRQQGDRVRARRRALHHAAYSHVRQERARGWHLLPKRFHVRQGADRLCLSLRRSAHDDRQHPFAQGPCDVRENARDAVRTPTGTNSTSRATSARRSRCGLLTSRPTTVSSVCACEASPLRDELHLTVILQNLKTLAAISFHRRR
jgi:hypothetical protein